MRTRTLGVPTSWEAWGDHNGDGTNSWDVQFVNPYPTPPANPQNQVCKPVDTDLATMSATLVYSQYLRKYMLMDRLAGSREQGVWYSTSTNLLNWDPPKLLMKAEVPPLSGDPDCVPPHPVRLPALIDHTSGARNYDTIGQRPYLYFTRSIIWENLDTGGCVQTHNRDLVRIPIEFLRPSAPTLTATVPVSPANDNAPKVQGNATGGSTVSLFTSPTCSGSPVATGSAATFASPGLTVSVADDSTTTFYATATDQAGESSSCSTSSITYVESSPAAAPPILTATDPVSPANDNAPKVNGNAPAGSTVSLFTSPTCSGSPVTTGSAATFASPGLTVSVADDSTTTFYATATDQAGETSSCSTSSIAYVESSPGPAAPILTSTDPASPANDNAPKLRGSAPAGTTLRIFAGAGCGPNPVATGSAAAFASPGLTVSVTDDSTTTFYATATDQAGETSSCSTSSITYVEDSTVEVPPVSVPSPPPADAASPLGSSIMPDKLAPLMALATRAVKMSSRRVVRLRLTCPATEPGGCLGSVRLETRGRKMRLGKSSFQIAGGTTARVAVNLSKQAGRLVRKRRRVQVRAVVQARDKLGNGRTAYARLILKA